MECSVSVIRNALFLFVAIGLMTAPATLRAEETLVLIAHKDSRLQSLGSLEIRKLNLGFIFRDEERQPIRAVANGSDTHLWNVFLQGVMGMSDRSYERRLLTLTLQSGRIRPHVVTNLEQLLRTIETEPNAVAFVWRRDLVGRDDLKVLRVLWQE
jgi:hypothetical protein